MLEKYYSIHDLVTIVLRDYRTFVARELSLFEKDYGYFYQQKIGNDKADLIIELGKFTPQKNCKSIENNIYKVKEDYLFGEFSYKIAKYNFDLSNFENAGDPVLVRIQPNLFANLVVHEQVIDFIIHFLLNRQGCSTLHASSVSKDGHSIVFTGQGNSGKTSFALLSVGEGYHFMGDDRVILDKENVYAFPECIGFHRSNSQYVENFMCTTDKSKLLLNDFISKISLGYIGAGFTIEAKNFFPENIEKKSHLKTMVCLQPSNKFQISNLNQDELIKKMSLNQRFENRRFLRHIYQYSTIYTDNELEKNQDMYARNLRSTIPKSIEAYEVRFTPKDYSRVNDWLKKEVFW